MVNLVLAVIKPLLKGLMKMAGLRHRTLEIEPGTVISIWLPKEEKKGTSSQKPAVLMLHAFVADGMMTWLFQVLALTKMYDVYVPDLLFFGGSTTRQGGRSPEFQAKCMVASLEKLGVRRCSVVGLCYGGMVAFKMAETRPDFVTSLVVSGGPIAMTEHITRETLGKLGLSSYAELLLPRSVEGIKALLSAGMYKKLWIPDRLHMDFLKVMFKNRKERAELLEALVVSKEDDKVPSFPQRMFLLWGENDSIFDLQLAKNMKEQLGETATLQGIKKAGHLANIERPCIYNHFLKDFLIMANDDGNNE